MGISSGVRRSVNFFSWTDLSSQVEAMAMVER